MEGKEKEPCKGMAQQDNYYSMKSFIRVKVFHGMKHDGLPNLFEVAKAKAIRNQKKQPVSEKDNCRVYLLKRKFLFCYQEEAFAAQEKYLCKLKEISDPKMQV